MEPYLGEERRKDSKYYQRIISKALELLEVGKEEEAVQVLRGEITKCPTCGGFLTFDHECTKGGGKK